MISAFVIALLVIGTAASGAVFKPGPWYASLDKPGWTPPNWAFPVVWTILYVMIALAGWLIWQAAGFGTLFVIWLVQLACNAAWSWLFFGLRRMDLALADICIMIVLILVFVVLALPVSVAAGLLFVPYAAWVVLAAALNRAVWRLNQHVARS